MDYYVIANLDLLEHGILLPIDQGDRETMLSRASRMNNVAVVNLETKQIVEDLRYRRFPENDSLLSSRE